jgi:multidrug resistance efflux pump
MRISRSYLLLILVCVGLLAGSIGVAIWALRRPAASSQTDNQGDSPLQPIAVCFGRVDVESGVVSLYPLQPGRVEEVKVKEGEPVTKGAVLLVLDNQLPINLVEQARQDLEAANAELDQAKKLGQQQKLREAQQQAVIDAVKERIKAAEAIYSRKKDLADIKAIKEQEVEAALAQVNEAKAVERGEEKKLAELRLNNPPAGQKFTELRRAEANVAAKKARLAQAELSLTECQLRAPMDGTILRVLVNKGDILSAQPKQPALLLAPSEDLIVRAEVEQEFAARVRKGQAAVLEDDANDKFEWHGVVDRMSDWYTQRRSILLEPGQLNDVRTIEAIIRLKNTDTASSDQPPLRIGQRVRVIILESKR